MTDEGTMHEGQDTCRVYVDQIVAAKIAEYGRLWRKTRGEVVGELLTRWARSSDPLSHVSKKRYWGRKNTHRINLDSYTASKIAGLKINWDKRRENDVIADLLMMLEEGKLPNPPNSPNSPK